MPDVKKFSLSSSSLSKLNGVNERLVSVVKRAIEITEVDFAVIQGLRTASQQQEAVAKGASNTLDSKHLTGNAVDLAAYVNGIKWGPKYLYDGIAKAMKQASRELKVNISWGGDWKGRAAKLGDYGHFELE